MGAADHRHDAQGALIKTVILTQYADDACVPSSNVAPACQACKLRREVDLNHLCCALGAAVVFRAFAKKCVNTATTFMTASRLQEERASQDGGVSNGAVAEEAHAELPDTYTKAGKLVDPKMTLQGVPALRVSRVEVVLSAGKGANGESHADAASLEPTEEQRAHRDPSGACARCASYQYITV